jgi:HSP20 family protein
MPRTQRLKADYTHSSSVAQALPASAQRVIQRKEIAMTSLIRLSGVPTVRWNPVGFRTHTRPEVTGIDRALHSLATEMFGSASESTAELRADVRETATAYLVQFDVPGVSKADITVDVDEKTVRVEASFKRDAVEGETTLLSERANTAVTRQLRLPHAVDAELATALHEHGVLTLTLPKKNAATQKRLAIN